MYTHIENMAEIFSCVDIRRKVFCLKTHSIKKERKEMFREVLNEFEEILDKMYSEMDGDLLLYILDEREISKLSRDEYLTALIETLAHDKYYNASFWILDTIYRIKEK